MPSMSYELVAGDADLENVNDRANCLDGVRASPRGGGSGIAMTICVLVFLTILGVSFTVFMGIDLDVIAPDIAKRAWPKAAQDVASALEKLEKQLSSGVWHDLTYVPGALLQAWALAIHCWPMACAGLAAMAGLLFLGMRAPKQSGCSWQEAASRSLQKCLRLSFGTLLPVCLMYSDMMTDLLVLQKFWSRKQLEYFTLNLFAIINGSVTSAIIGPGGVHIDMQSEALQGMRGHLHVLSGLQLAPLLCMTLAFKEFWTSDFDSGRSWSFENKLRDKGITALLHSTTIGEPFGEALLSSFVQLYAALRQGPLQWPSLLAFSVLLSLFSISKSFACIDQMGKVARYRHGQAIVVGLANPASMAFVGVVLYRLTAVCSRLLLFPLFQLALHQELQMWKVAYGGALLWSVDCILQAALVLYSTGNYSKLLLAVPNTISAYEPLLLKGSDAFLSVKIPLHALVHAAEAIVGVCIVTTYGSSKANFWEERRSLLRLFTASTLLQWPLLWLLRRFCAYEILQKPHVIDILSDQTKMVCDEADAKVPLDVAALVPFAISSGCDVEKLLALVVQGGVPPHVTEQILLLVKCKTFSTDGRAMMELGAAQVILTGLKRHRDHAAVQEAGCSALRNLAVNAENQAKLMELEAAQALLEAMKRHRDHVGVQEQACHALRNLADSAENKVKLMELEAAQAILEAMKRHRDHAAVQEQGCAALRNLGNNNAENQVKLMELEAAQAILEAVKRHGDHAAVQEQGCGALWNLAVNAENKVKLMELEAAQAILEAMKRHRDHAAVQEQCCGALWNLAMNAENKVKMMELEAAQDILEAMTRHRDHAAVQQNGCGALLSLAINAENKVKLMELEAAQAILEAMRGHRDHAAVQQFGCGALRNLAVNDENKVKLMELEAAQAILEAVKRHRDHAAVQQNGCGALLSLAVNDENKVKLMELEAAQAILEAMRGHRDHAAVQQFGCSALRNLAMNAENKVKLMELEAAQAIQEAMKRYRDHAAVQENGCGALKLLGCSTFEEP